MSPTDIIIVALAFPAVVFAALTVMVRNIVYASVFLICSLLCIAGVYVGLKSDFIAAAQLAIYVGAISILILFAIMFVHDKESKKLTHLNRQAVLGVFVSLCLFGIICFYIFSTKPIEISRGLTGQSNMANRPTAVNAISNTLYNGERNAPYAIPVEMASFLIIAAMVGGIELAKKKEDEV